MTSSYWNLALPCPLRRLFCYQSDTNQAAQPGDWVEVPFGRRRVRALVVDALDAAPEGIEIRQIISVAPADQRLPTPLLELVRWAIRYYHAAPWDAVTSLVPALLSRGKMPGLEPLWAVAADARSRVGARAKRQAELLTFLEQEGTASRARIRAAGFSAALLKQVIDSELIQGINPHSLAGEASAAGQSAAKSVCRSSLLLPNEWQQEAIESVRKQPNQRFLLQGVTGSGKSLVYQHLVADALQRGEQVLVLVPEIGLVQPMVEHLSVLGTKVSTYNSSMTDIQRASVWRKAQAGEVSLVVGTRSAVALPMPCLGLMVIDEEQDTSYKQQEGMRYQARDIAQLRSVREGFTLVLGSATPSLELLKGVEQGAVNLLLMPQRVHGAALPTWHLAPLASQAGAPFSSEALARMGDSLGRGEQVMVFLNRRGYAPLLQCRQCGWQARCEACDVRLTWHRSRREMRCHQCDKRSPVPARCGHCQSTELMPLGLGTERIEEQIEQLFGGVPVVRIDRDSVRGRDGFQRQLSQIQPGRPAVLVGTQMLAKGHHFPELSLAVILDLDFALQSPDFKAAEQAVQLIMQIAGRTGREKLAGHVIVQTALPGHPLFSYVTANNYPGFAEDELERRARSGLPPFTYMALIRAESEQVADAEDALQALSCGPDCQMLGPYPCLTERRQGRFRYQVQLISDSRSSLHRQLDQWVQQLESHPNRRLRWHLDVDPVSMDG